jgi:bifunctional DNA-binding transcriptional regulator/antitoxin component of YhaV-PrlF toxin-antitoxin module
MSFTTFNFRVAPNGRTSIPAGVRKEAGIVGEAELVAHADGHGRIVIETRDSIREQIWAMFPEAIEIDAFTAVREARDADRIMSVDRLDTLSHCDVDVAVVGARLAELGF